MQAMIITAYQDFASLERMVRALSTRALCFVHVDAKSAITQAQTAQLNAMENVRAIRKYRINWGSVRHLHALGHRRIAFIGGSMQFKDNSKRGENFLEELRALDLPDDPAYHVDAGFDAESGERAILRMLSGLERKRWPTAIIAFNDQMALGAIKQLKQMGLRLPEDMAIIGCDNQFFCPYTDPPLTSIDLHPEEMTQSAVRELLVAREGNRTQSFSMMREATLIVRESCGAKLGYRKRS